MTLQPTGIEGGPTVKGADVLDELLALLDRRLPDMADDDPVRPHDYRRALAPMPSVARLMGLHGGRQDAPPEAS